MLLYFTARLSKAFAYSLTAVNNPTDATFKIADTKLYVPVVTLSTEDDNKLLEQLKTRFKRKLNQIVCRQTNV